LIPRPNGAVDALQLKPTCNPG